MLRWVGSKGGGEGRTDGTREVVGVRNHKHKMSSGINCKGGPSECSVCSVFSVIL